MLGATYQKSGDRQFSSIYPLMVMTVCQKIMEKTIQSLLIQSDMWAASTFVICHQHGLEGEKEHVPFLLLVIIFTSSCYQNTPTVPSHYIFALILSMMTGCEAV